MTVTANQRLVADVRLERLDLQPLLGAYELLLVITGAMRQPVPSAHQSPYWFDLWSALVSIDAAGGHRKRLGIARAMRPYRFVQSTEQALQVDMELRLTLQPAQVLAIEEFCHEQPMRLVLQPFGEGGDVQAPRTHGPITDQWSLDVPRSVWIDRLRTAGVLDIVSIEVPLPAIDPPEAWRDIVVHLRRAQKHWLEGNYLECVSACRLVMDATDGNAASVQRGVEALKKLAVPADRQAMNLEERQIAILSAVRNFTHLAHHPVFSGGVFAQRGTTHLAYDSCCRCGLCQWGREGALTEVGWTYRSPRK